MQSIFHYTVPYYMPKRSKIRYTQAYTGYMQSIFHYTVAYYMPKRSKIRYTQAYTGYMQSIFHYTISHFMEEQNRTMINKISVYGRNKNEKGSKNLWG